MADTPAQTVGPFLHLALAEPAVRGGPAGGDAIDDGVVVHGFVLDGDGVAVPDALVETWQHGGPFARCATGPDGGWEVRTRFPAPLLTLDGTAQAPHLALSVFARGLLDRVVTRLYFEGDAANATDPTLRTVGSRAATLLARPDGSSSYRFDIRLQGTDESVFFAV